MKRTILCLSLLALMHAGYSQNTADTTATNPPSVEVAGIKITGSIDVYYRYNFANAKDTAGNPITNNYTSFTNSQNSFELGMASIQASHSFGKASAFIDLGFGRRAEEFSYANTDHSTLFAVKQAYLSYAVTISLN